MHNDLLRVVIRWNRNRRFDDAFGRFIFVLEMRTTKRDEQAMIVEH